MPSNGAVANVLYHDLDLHFQGHTLLNVNISKTVRASGKKSVMCLILVDFRLRIEALRMLYSGTLT